MDVSPVHVSIPQGQFRLGNKVNITQVETNMVEGVLYFVSDVLVPIDLDIPSKFCETENTVTTEVY